MSTSVQELKSSSHPVGGISETLILQPAIALRATFLLIVAGALAIVLVPDDVEPIGAVRLPALILAVALVAPALWEGWRNPKMLFCPQNVLAFSPVFWLLLDPIQGSYPLLGFSSLQLRIVFAAITLFSVAGWLGALRPSTWLVDHLPRGVFQQFAVNTYFGLGLLAFGLAFLRFAIPAEFDLPLMFNSLLEDRWSAPWARGDLGGWDALTDHLAYFGYILPLLTVLLSRRVGWFDIRTLLIGLCASIITLFIAQGGGRRIIGVLLGSAVAFWFLGLPRVRSSSIIFFLASVIGIGLALNSVLEVRTQGVAAEQIEKSEQGEDEDVALIKIDDNFLRLVQVTTIFPKYNGYTTWRYPLWVAVRPVPRVLWPGKPVDSGFDLAEFLGLEGVSLTCSVIGELFMSGGLVAVFLGGLLYGRVAGLLIPLSSPQNGPNGLLLYSGGLLMLFAGMRSMIELLLMSYMLGAWILLCYFRPAVKG